jgi:hypothetical protein
LSGWWDRWRYVWDRWRHMRICGGMMHAEGERLIVRYLVTPLCVPCNAFALLPLFCPSPVTSKNDPGNWYNKILQASLRRYIIPSFALPFPAAACHNNFAFGSWIRKNSQEKTDILSHWMSIQFQERTRAWVSLDDAHNRHGSCTVTLLAILPHRSSLPLWTATIAAPALHLVQNLKCFQKEMIVGRRVWFIQKTSLWFLEVERFNVVEVMIVVLQGCCCCCCLRFHAVDITLQIARIVILYCTTRILSLDLSDYSLRSSLARVVHNITHLKLVGVEKTSAAGMHRKDMIDLVPLSNVEK